MASALESAARSPLKDLAPSPTREEAKDLPTVAVRRAEPRPDVSRRRCHRPPARAWSRGPVPNVGSSMGVPVRM